MVLLNEGLGGDVGGWLVDVEWEEMDNGGLKLVMEALVEGKFREARFL